EGYLYFAGVGGWDWQILVGQRVEVITRDGHRPGVVGKKPIHLLKEDDRKKVADVKDLHIDIGARDGDEARDLVRIGDVAVIAGGSTINPHVFELLYETAEAEDIPFTVEAHAGRTGTDADAVHLSKAGVPTGVVSVPLRYMHSPVEMVQLDDVHACARLIAA